MKPKKNTQPDGQKKADEQKKATDTAEAESTAAKPQDTAEPAPEPAAEAKTDAQAPQPLSEAETLKLLLQSSGTEIARLKKDLKDAAAARDAAQAKADALNSRLAATLSEYENYRRRTAAEKETLGADATAKAVSALLPALDSLERALSFENASAENLREGVQMTCKQLSAAFEKLGVAEIEIKPGDTFDPARQNAVAHVEDETLGDSVVAEVFQKGYAIGEKVVRHAVVKVAN